MLYCKNGCNWVFNYFHSLSKYYHSKDTHKYGSEADVLKNEMCIWFWNYANSNLEENLIYSCNIKTAIKKLLPFFPNSTLTD